MASKPQIELLAPAGNWECARAAVENGADAIYFGLDVGFNARARATNFHVGELKQLMHMLHRQAVRGYVTLNTLVFTDEFPALEDNLRSLAEAGVDAVLVQDLGVARLVHRLCPELEIHASTQMTLTHPAAIELVGQLGISRVVLARELSISEIRKIASTTQMPLEVFVHGALCVAYSGQCLTSESLGGRSANRGQCAQACRLPYDLVCDGDRQDLGDIKYLLSPQDLAAHDLVPQLIDAGVCSLKIEGRLKTPEYVANTCAHYRAAIDDALRQQPRVLSEQARRELELSFSRGFSPGWLEGCDHKRLVPGLSSAKRGVLLGEISAAGKDCLHVELHGPLATGDGIVIQGDRFAGNEIGGRVYELFQDGHRVTSASSGKVRIGLQRGSLTGRDIPSGARIWKTDDPQLTKRLRQTFDSPDPRRRVPVDLTIEVHVGKPIRIEAAISGGQPIRLSSEYLPETARKHPVTADVVTQQFARLGGTVYQLEKCAVRIEGSPMVPLSVWGKLRHELVERLDFSNTTRPITCTAGRVAEEMLEGVIQTPPSAAGPPVLRVLCRSVSQLQAALAAGADHVIADLHDVRQNKQAVELARRAGATIELATLRIQKPGEDGLLRSIAKLDADGWLVRNLTGLRFAVDRHIPVACDFSLNVTNPLTAQQLKRWGASRVTAAYDLNRDQLLELCQRLPADWIEVVLHQHMPMFHMEHCVFCSVLSPGKNKSDCGRPCDRHDVQLVDRVGAAHVLHADIGCRNTLYNGTAQSGAEAVAPLLQVGVRQFRIELLRDAASDEINRLIGLYRRLVDGQVTGAAVWQTLKADNRVGVTRGTLEQARNPLAIL